MISVIIPSYNRAALIDRAVMSVYNQTYKDIEIIVVDDASSDNTEEVIKSLKVACLKYIKLPENGGACHARNVGIQAAQGEYIAFLDSDDTWELSKLEDQISFLNAKKADVVFCNYWKERDGKKEVKVKSGHSEVFTLSELLNANVITTGSLLLAKNALEKAGHFDESMPRYQDWELVLRLSKIFPIYFQDKALLTLYFQENSITNSTSKAKKFFALEKMVQKNQEEMLANKTAYAHHCWSMGLYSMYMDTKRWDLLKLGVSHDGFNLRRFAIYCLLKMGFVNLFKKMYSKDH